MKAQFVLKSDSHVENPRNPQARHIGVYDATSTEYGRRYVAWVPSYLGLEMSLEIPMNPDTTCSCCSGWLVVYVRTLSNPLADPDGSEQPQHLPKAMVRCA